MGYLKKYEFGFMRDDKRVLSWVYTVNSSGNIETDERAGKMFADVDLSNTTFFNYLWYTDKYFALPSGEKENFKNSHPVNRTSGNPPGDGSGYWTGTQKNYSSEPGVADASVARADTGLEHNGDRRPIKRSSSQLVRWLSCARAVQQTNPRLSRA